MASQPNPLSRIPTRNKALRAYCITIGFPKQGLIEPLFLEGSFQWHQIFWMFLSFQPSTNPDKLTQVLFVRERSWLAEPIIIGGAFLLNIRGVAALFLGRKKHMPFRNTKRTRFGSAWAETIFFHTSLEWGQILCFMQDGCGIQGGTASKMVMARLKTLYVQLLPSDLLITQMEITQHLKRSLKAPKKVTRKNLAISIYIC